MKSNRRKFIKASAMLGMGIFFSTKSLASSIVEKSVRYYNTAFQKIIIIIEKIKSEGSNLCLKIMDGKEYVRDPFYHYPEQGGIVDKKSRSRVFFHAHRENEYGHFHTFIEDEDGELVHLVLISMDENGIPVELATVNRWVTGDKYLKSNQIKKMFGQFKIDKSHYKDERILNFIEHVFEAYKDKIFTLLDERDEWIRNYVRKYTREPFEDRDYEILSSAKIDVYSGSTI